MGKKVVFDRNEAKKRGDRLIECFESVGLSREQAAAAVHLSYNNFGRYLRGESYLSDGRTSEFVHYINARKKLYGDSAINPGYVLGSTEYMTEKDKRHAIQVAVDSDNEGSSKAFTYLLSVLGIEIRGYYVEMDDDETHENCLVYLGKDARYRYIPINGNIDSIDFHDLGKSPYYELKFAAKDEESIVVLSSVEYDLLIQEIKEFVKMRLLSIRTIHDNLHLISKQMLTHPARSLTDEEFQRLVPILLKKHKAELSKEEE